METRYRRFSTGRIIEHLVHIALFCILVVTGLSQRFYTFDLSVWVILKMGGIDAVRIVHRCAGIVFSLAAAVHLAVAAAGILARRWQPSLVISVSDLSAAVHNIKYYLGLRERPAANGKFSYTQKFEYWGILTGGLLMIATGAVLWKPLLVTRFMAGEVIPLAKVLHSNEALVVLLLIAGWHMYNAVFSPDAFPLNGSIFSGYISRERMARLHLAELARREECTPEEILEDLEDHETAGLEVDAPPRGG